MKKYQEKEVTQQILVRRCMRITIFAFLIIIGLMFLVTDCLYIHSFFTRLSHPLTGPDIANILLISGANLGVIYFLVKNIFR